jgi:hypothetical protein
MHTYGPKDSKIIVICDPFCKGIGQHFYGQERGLPMASDCMQLMLGMMSTAGIDVNQLLFLQGSPADLQLDVYRDTSESKIKTAINSYKEKFLNYIKKLKPTLVVCLGKYAAT